MVKFAVVGCGNRSIDLLAHLRGQKEVVLHGAWDPLESNAKLLLEHCRQNRGEAYAPKVYASFAELLKDRQIDWVIIASPNAFHKEQIIAALQAGKHVFSEKPLATNIADCVAIKQAHERSDRLLAMGFTLRYASIYRQAKKILDSGKLGRIISINACENIAPEHGYYIVHNWRRSHELSGPHILEKCVHDLDLLNWFCASLPVKIAAFGGNNMFVPENKELYFKNRELFETMSAQVKVAKFDEAEDNSFVAEKNIEDNIVTIMEYSNSIRVQFQATMSNCLPERRMYFHCTGGNMIIELYSGKLIYQVLGENETKSIDHIGGGHGDGDYHIMQELQHSMLAGDQPLCGVKEGLQSAVVGISIDRARRENRVLDMTSIWQNLGVKLS